MVIGHNLDIPKHRVVLYHVHVNHPFSSGPYKPKGFEGRGKRRNLCCIHMIHSLAAKPLSFSWFSWKSMEIQLDQIGLPELMLPQSIRKLA